MGKNGFIDGLVRFSDLTGIFKKQFKFTKTLTNQGDAFTILESEHKKGKFPLIFFFFFGGQSTINHTIDQYGNISFTAALGGVPYNGTLIII